MTGPTGPTNTTKNAPNKSSGLQQPELRYLAIGRVVKAHGVRGEISVAVLTDFPERFDTTERVYLGNEFEAEAYQLKKFRWHKKNVLLTLDGIDDRDQAERLRGLFVQIPIEDVAPLPEGDFYVYELIGLQIVSTDNQVLGTLINILETGANDVYVVETPNKSQILLPAIPDVVREIDADAGKITVELIDGLI